MAVRAHSGWYRTATLRYSPSFLLSKANGCFSDRWRVASALAMGGAREPLGKLGFSLGSLRTAFEEATPMTQRQDMMVHIKALARSESNLFSNTLRPCFTAIHYVLVHGHKSRPSLVKNRK